MRFELAINLDKATYYGDVPDFFHCTSGYSEIFLLEDSDLPLLSVDFVDSVNEMCGTLLDIGDVDYFDVVQCKLLNEWLSNRLSESCTERLRYLYEKLQSFAVQAIELGTGVIVEL